MDRRTTDGTGAAGEAAGEAAANQLTAVPDTLHDAIERAKALLSPGQSLGNREHALPRQEFVARKLPFECVAFVLQGGGALGAYQAGVYQSLHEAGVEPNWIAGISIGAINSAIIAGNAPEDRLDKLHAFWDMATTQPDHGLLDEMLALWEGDDPRRYANRFTAFRTTLTGAPGFFSLRFPPPYLMPSGHRGAVSYYDTSLLKGTLERLVDFDRINHKQAMRFSIGAVNVRTGNFAYFDTETHTIRPEHVMASGALPPGFPAIEIEGEYYWDGGIVSNTPLDWILGNYPLLDTLVFQVDLWSARGNIPRDLAQVATRLKEVQFSSRTRSSTERFRELQKARGAVADLLAKLPPDLVHCEEAEFLRDLADPCVYNIVQLIYQSPVHELDSKDYNFSRQAMLDHWERGYVDGRRTLDHKQIFQRPRKAQGVQVFDYCSNR